MGGLEPPLTSTHPNCPLRTVSGPLRACCPTHLAPSPLLGAGPVLFGDRVVPPTFDEHLAALTPDPAERAALLARIRHETARRARRGAADALPRVVRTEKRCAKCGETKPVAAFGIDRRRPDGRFPYCRACRV